MSNYLVHFDNVLTGDTVLIKIDGTEYTYRQASPFVRDGEALGQFCDTINTGNAYIANPLPDSGVGIVAIEISGATEVEAAAPLFQVRV